MTMQVLGSGGNPKLRLPMLDLTNLQQKTFDHSKPSVVIHTAKAPSQSVLRGLRAYATVDSTEPAKCSHLHKMKANGNGYTNCIDCGAFVSHVPFIVPAYRRE